MDYKTSEQMCKVGDKIILDYIFNFIEGLSQQYGRELMVDDNWFYESNPNCSVYKVVENNLELFNKLGYKVEPGVYTFTRYEGGFFGIGSVEKEYSYKTFTISWNS